MIDEAGTRPSGANAMSDINITPLIDVTVSSMEDLAARLRDVFQGRSDKTIFVKAGGTIAYGRVVEAMDVARGAGAERMGLMSERSLKP